MRRWCTHFRTDALLVVWTLASAGCVMSGTHREVVTARAVQVPTHVLTIAQKRDREPGSQAAFERRRRARGLIELRDDRPRGRIVEPEGLEIEDGERLGVALALIRSRELFPSERHPAEQREDRVIALYEVAANPGSDNRTKIKLQLVVLLELG